MIDFKPEDYVVGMWFVPGEEMDWMGCLWVTQGTDTVIGRYRFRYYDQEDPGNDAFSGKDTKRWYSMKGKVEDLTELEKSLHKAAALVADKQGSDVYFVEVRANGEKAAELLAKQPWAHVKPVETAAECGEGVPS